MERRRKTASGRNPITALLEDVLGCKWSWRVLREIRAGVTRPGQLERAIEGISAKVLNERLRKLQRHGVLEKIEHAEIPPRVEYRFTPLGEKFFAVLEQVEAVEREYAVQPASGHGPSPHRTGGRG